MPKQKISTHAIRSHADYRIAKRKYDTAINQYVSNISKLHGQLQNTSFYADCPVLKGDTSIMLADVFRGNVAPEGTMVVINAIWLSSDYKEQQLQFSIVGISMKLVLSRWALRSINGVIRKERKCETICTIPLSLFDGGNIELSNYLQKICNKRSKPTN